MAVNRRKARHRAPPGGKFLLVGPDWNGQKPEGFGFAFHHLLLPALSLFHRDPKWIVGVLRLTFLNRLNSSSVWAELPLGRQTQHHDWLSCYRGLKTPLLILSLGIKLAHSFNLNVSG